ncbi:MAG: hypothetical protein VX246_09270 [Myxococcota bacterium]|nr:hypothetical protein [Myxococcota bacterium]
MPVNPELLDILVCPETKQAVSPAGEEVVSKLNEQVSAGSLRNRGGDPVTASIAEGLIREDGKILYIVEDSIPVMLIEESIEL